MSTSPPIPPPRGTAPGPASQPSLGFAGASDIEPAFESPGGFPLGFQGERRAATPDGGGRRGSGAVLAEALGARAAHRRHAARGGTAAPPGTGDRALLLTLGLGALTLAVLAIA